MVFKEYNENFLVCMIGPKLIELLWPIELFYPDLDICCIFRSDQIRIYINFNIHPLWPDRKIKSIARSASDPT